MKTKTIPFVLLVGISLIHCKHASATDAIINWLGDGGYRARITMNYDDSFATVLARGDLSFSGPLTNQGITQLSVSFFNPTSFQPIFSTQDVSNGIVTYRFLTIALDNVSRTLSGSLDVGRDSFAEGDPGSPAGQFYLVHTSSTSLIDSFTGQPVDSGGQFTVTVVPEPSTWSLCVVAIAAGSALWGRKRPNEPDRA